jgi:hypothetical protein
VAPAIRFNVQVKCYFTGQAPLSVWWASPDVAGGMSQGLSFNLANDSQGSFFTASLPSLEYWDVLVPSP